MKPWLPVLAMVALAGASAPAAAADHTQTITLREPLGNTWPDELVHRDVDVPQDHVAAAGFALTDADGKPLALQVEVLEGKPDAVRRARLWLKTTLERNAEVALRLTWNDDGRAAASAPAAGGLTVRREGDRLVIATGAVEVALAAPDRRFEKPVEFAKAPAPILAVRPAGDAAWYGQWLLEGPARVREVRTAVEAEGPLWARVRMTYVFEDKGHAYEVAVRAERGEPWIDVEETYRLPAASRAVFVLDGRLKPAEVLWMPWFIGTNGDMRPAYDVRRDRLADRAREGRPVATLRPRWTQVRDNAQVCLAVGSGAGNPAVGAMMTHPAAWVHPYGQLPVVRAAEDGAGMRIEFPLADGRRRWALLAGPVKRFDSKGELQLLARRLADVPLDRVLNEWVFDWPRDPARPAPHILATHERVAAIRADVAAGADTPAARLVRAVVKGDLPGDRKLAEYLAGRREQLGGPDIGAEMFLGRAYQDAFLSPAAYPRRLATALRLADLSATGRPAGNAEAALVGYVASDPDYWPGYAGGWDVGNPTYHRDVAALAIGAAAMMPDHPHARRWMDAALAGLRDDFRRHVGLPDGTARAAPGAQAAALAEVLPLLAAARNSGLTDPWSWPEVRGALEHLRRLHMPVDPRLGRRCLVPAGAAPWQDGVGALFGIAAAGVAKADPKLAAAWMAMYRHYYGDGGSGDLATDVLLADASLAPGRLEDADWTSRAAPGFGAVLRSRFGTPHEAFAAFTCGGAGGGRQGDEMSFHFFGATTPVALDWYAGAAANIDQEHMHNRVNLGDNENMDAAGRVLALKTSDAGDLVVGQAASNHLRRMPRFPHEVAPGATFPRRTLDHEARYRRLLLLVKHPDGPLEDYLVVRDELATTEPATFNLFVLARSVRREGRAFHFDGQLAANAVLYVATPADGKVEVSNWAWPRQDASSLVPEGFQSAGKDRWRAGEWQQWVRVTETPGRPLLTVLYPCRKGEPAPAFQTLADGRGVRVTLGQATEDVFLATDPAGEAGGQAVVVRGGRKTVILPAKGVPPL